VRAAGVAGYHQPDRRIFLAALEALGTPPGRSVFVGDSLKRDMLGAKALGMKHIWLAGGKRKNSRPCCPEDEVIGTLRDLSRILL
jgi:FMN phosphatase YigB (HAD superfamily)